jgi:uncharacterized membrane protein required for colicin V production
MSGRHRQLADLGATTTGAGRCASGESIMLDVPGLSPVLLVGSGLPIAGFPIETAGWHWLDMTLGLGLVVVALNAARRGFVREAGTLVGVALGLILASRHALALADFLAREIGRLPFLDDAAWLAIVVVSASVTALLAGVLRNALALPGIGLADRVFGLAFGVLEGAAVLGLGLLFVVRLSAIGVGAHALDGSALAPILLRWWLVVAASLPPELGVPRVL